MDRREHHRAQLRLPVRIRWSTPFGQKTEVRKTLDISRGGLLVPCEEPHALGVPLWVTFPYDASMGDGQPEIMAKVVRVSSLSQTNGNRSGEDSASQQAMAMYFALPARAALNGNEHRQGRERREAPRRPLAIPVRVRPESMPWFEEAMTIDVSANGLRFLSGREYQMGERLLVSFELAASAVWPSTAECTARVVRTEAVPETAALAVSVSRQP
jgi:hypothetical protein